jgi:hypothetical protein
MTPKRRTPVPVAQTAAEAIGVLSQVFSPRGAAQIPADELRQADNRVGNTSERRLRWAMVFAQLDPVTAGDWYNAQIELGAFLHPWFKSDLADSSVKTLPFSQVLFPSREQVGTIKERFAGLLNNAAGGAGYSFDAERMSVSVGPSGISFAIASHLTDLQKHERAQVELAMLRLSELIAPHWGYIGVCREDGKTHFGCGRLFLKSRSDREYCSKTCTNRSMTYRRRAAKRKKTLRSRGRRKQK